MKYTKLFYCIDSTLDKINRMNFDSKNYIGIIWYNYRLKQDELLLLSTSRTQHRVRNRAISKAKNILHELIFDTI